MRNRVLAFGLLGLLAVFCDGCGSSEAPVPGPEEMKAELMRAWREIPKSGTDSLDVGSASVIAQRMAQFGPDGLDPLLEVIAAPEEDPVAKVLAVISLTPLLRPEMAPRLIELTGESNETTTRACAANLLALLDDPEGVARMQQLCEDSEHRVRVAAQLAMISRRDPVQCTHILDLWRDPATDARQRTQLVLVLPDTNEAEYLPIFSEAIVATQLEPVARQRAATALGRLGDASALPALEQCAASDPHPEVVSLAKSAIAAIQARVSAPPAPAVPGAQPEPGAG